MAADFAPGEIKTFFVPDDPQLPVREVSLLEWPPDAPAGFAGNGSRPTASEDGGPDPDTAR
jgi:alpha-mannosidase